MTVSPELISQWMGSARWFGGKGRDWTVTAVAPLAELDAPSGPIRLLVARVEYAGGEVESYQVPLALHEQRVEALDRAYVGEIEEDGRTWYAYDALHDRTATALLLKNLRTGATVGDVTFAPLKGADDIPPEVSSRVLSAEQSNTSLVYDDSAILKVFRKLAPGENPDIEIHEALLGVGCEYIAAPLGHIAGRWEHIPGETVDGSLAMLQEFLATASDGWGLAQSSVRDLFAEADLHADEVGGDFAGESFRLGAATAAVHADLARALPTGTFGPERLQPLASAMKARLEVAVREVPEAAPYAPALTAAYDALAARTEPVPVQRIHGDYHLGQVMRTPTGWRLLDFEGEPAKSLAERRAPDSPVRDVAGMLRSFDYAARHQLIDRPRDPQLEYRAEEWAQRNRSAFCDGYASVAGADPRADAGLLLAYETDKAVYELLYEARNRPSWVRIPLSAIERLSAAAAADAGGAP
ncbi:maltokinase N-terminal cap-like domain-containing protein [Motilibacter aurantiacus]|uniref:maltokinase N-terminal cap-like domain-containing protein n=1 Tax=Motilibacter aurantiacus TaxID=2714955 RepID=UPI002F2B68AC